jgi:hypothetical protein
MILPNGDMVARALALVALLLSVVLLALCAGLALLMIQVWP